MGWLHNFVRVPAVDATAQTLSLTITPTPYLRLRICTQGLNATMCSAIQSGNVMVEREAVCAQNGYNMRSVRRMVATAHISQTGVAASPFAAL